jgi:hypothetical protein
VNVQQKTKINVEFHHSHLVSDARAEKRWCTIINQKANAMLTTGLIKNTVHF